MNKCVRFSLLLLIYFKLARFEINTSETRPSLICEASDLSPSEFDCSNNKLNWLDLKNLIDSTFSATILNLSRNKFNSNIPNLAFNNFKTLNETLNLSSNGLETIEPMAFYFDKKMSRNENEPIQFDTLKIINLDLSSNSFKTIPWNSIRSLKHLQHLYLNSNQITSLDLGDLSINDHDHNNILSSIKYLYLKSNKITYIDFKILKYLVNLNLLDLSSNSLKSIDFMIGQILSFNNEQRITNEYTKLEVKNNPLVCDCNLLWFKKYIKNYYNDNDAKDQMCTLRHPDESSSFILFKIETIDLATNNNETDYKNVTNFIFSNNHRLEKIISLDDSKYLCELHFNDSLSKHNIIKVDNRTFQIELNCVVTGFPRPVIRWNIGNKAIIKNLKHGFYIIDKEYSILNNQTNKTTFVSDMYTVSSKLLLERKINSESIEYHKNYSCRAKYDQNALFDNQKIIIFKYKNNASALKFMLDQSDDGELYWCIILLVLLFSVIGILLFSIITIRAAIKGYKLEKDLIEKQKCQTLSRRSMNQYIIAKNELTYHMYCNSDTTTTTSALREPSQYMNSFVFSSPISFKPNYVDPPELDRLMSTLNQSNDENVVIQNTFVSIEPSESTSSRSYYENIEQYQEPKVIREIIMQLDSGNDTDFSEPLNKENANE